MERDLPSQATVFFHILFYSLTRRRGGRRQEPATTPNQVRESPAHDELGIVAWIVTVVGGRGLDQRFDRAVTQPRADGVL